MPNNCSNHLICDGKHAAKLRELFLNEDTELLTFQKICPMPEWILKVHSLGNLENDIELVQKELSGEQLTKDEKEKLDQEIPFENDDGSKTTHRANAVLALKAKAETGSTDGWMWAIANWGTKWEPYSMYLGEDTFFGFNVDELEEGEHPDFYKFFTAWTPPSTFYKVLSKYVDFEAYYAEVGQKFAGKFHSRNGELEEYHYEYDKNPEKYKEILLEMDMEDYLEEENE